MIAHRYIDYTIYFSVEDLKQLALGQTITCPLQGRGETNIELSVSLKSNPEIEDFYKKKNKEYKKKAKAKKKTNFLIFANECFFAVVYWPENGAEFLYFQDTWFKDATEKITQGKANSRTIRWGSDKIEILAGESSEAKRFRAGWEIIE